MSNIIELNKKLFETIEGLENGTVEIKKAQAIVNVSNAIANNAKLVISAAKLSKNPNMGSMLLGIEAPEPPKDTYDKKLEFAKSLGYKNITEAISKKGKLEFDSDFKEYQE